MKNLVVLCAACGVGKSTLSAALNANGALSDYACIDIEDTLINWWDYADTDRADRFYDDCLAEAVRMAGDKHLLFAACMNPFDFYGKVVLPQEITSTHFIGMTCSDEEIIKRLKARPEERMCGNDEFIAEQLEYNGWFRKNAGKFQLYIDNTGLTVMQTTEIIAKYAKSTLGSQEQ